MNTAQLLRDMGVEVWRLRSGRAVTGSVERESNTADLEPGIQAKGTGPPHRSARPDSQPNPATSRRVSVAPFTVLCLAKEDSLLLIEPTDLRAGRRFGADLLAAVTGNWADAARQLLFEWPQAGIADDELSVSKALGAFVSRQLGESSVGMKLVGSEVLERLDALPEECLVMAPTDQLMTDGDLKRALWKEISRRARS